MFVATKRKKKKPTSTSLSKQAFSGCCAGAQLDFPAQQFQGVAEVWVPFEEAIALGWR
jgi:hypothetical protein